MDLLMILIAIIGITVSIANKKNTAKAKQQRAAAQQREAAGGKPAASQGTTTRTSPAKAPAAPSKFPPIGPSKRPSTAAQKQQPRAAETSYGGTPRYTHVVTSTLEGGHTHTESSMTGEESCPPPKSDMKKPLETGKNRAVQEGAPLLSFQTNSVLQGVLYSEILGKPKALKRI